LATLDAEYMTFEVGMALDPDMGAAVRTHLDVVASALAPYDTGRQYLNFTEAHTDPSRFYRGGVYDRLREVRSRVDPGELFRANHPIAPAR
jgi:hypothetical protein